MIYFRIFKYFKHINKMPKILIETQKTQQPPPYSYGRFLQENPNATRKERQAAVKNFYTRNT